MNVISDVKYQIIPNEIPSLLSIKDMKDRGLDISIQDKLRSNSHRELFLDSPVGSRWDSILSLHRAGNTETPTRIWDTLQLAHSLRYWRVYTLTKCRLRLRKRYRISPKHANPAKSTQVCQIGSSWLLVRMTYVSTALSLQISYISAKRTELHIIVEATHFCAAQFLTWVSTAHVLKGFLKCWSRVYPGQPDYLQVDKGSQFVSKEFMEDTEAEGTKILTAQVESPTTMSHVEWYHAPLRAAYLKIHDSLPRSETDA